MHIPVLLREAVDSLAVRRGGVYVDGTLGRAGHAREILLRGGAGTTLVGIDRDEQALSESSTRLSRLPDVNVVLVHGCHGSVAEIVRGKGIGEVDGILLDLGVSSPQLDEAGRGFSFQADGPLDMRMDRSREVTAATLVATRTEEELAEISARSARSRTRGASRARSYGNARRVRSRRRASSRSWWSGRLGGMVRTIRPRGLFRRSAWP